MRYSNDPCDRDCKNCSQCTRAFVVRRNLKKYGSPDYPGGPVTWEDE